MRQSEAKEFLPIIQAWSEGKPIQYKSLRGAWLDVANDDWLDFINQPSNYRIKPEPRKPREIWVNELENGLCGYWLNSKEGAKFDEPNALRQVRFVEVVEDEQ